MTAVGTTLSTTNGTWSNNPTTFAYAWNRGASRIEGVNDPSYTVAINDVGQMISATVTAINAAGAGAADSNALGPIDPPPPPTNDGAPEIIGTAQVGATLVASNGGWLEGGLTFARQWFRDGTLILGAITQTYSPTDDDLDAMLTVTVTAITALGGSDSVTSDPAGPVIQAQPGPGPSPA
jgi:hypothetical protein